MRRSEETMIIATVEAMREKLNENTHKPPITDLTLPEAIVRMEEELSELLDELKKPEWDYAAIRRELADVINFAGAGLVDCDRVLFTSKVL